MSDGFEVTAHPTADRTVALPPGAPFYTRLAAGTGGVGTAAIGPDAGSGGLGSNVLAVADTDTSTSTSFPVIALLPSAINLNAVGSTATLGFNFRYTNNGVATASVNGFRFGFFNSNGTSVTADNQTASDNDVGYYAAIGTGGSTPATNGIFFNESGGTANLLGGTDRTNLTASSATGTGLNDNLPHTASLTLTRLSATSIQLALSIDGAAAITGTDTGTLRTSFDEIAFGGGFNTAGNAYNLDNVTVDGAVPEPAALGLAALAAPLLLARRPGRRKN